MLAESAMIPSAADQWRLVGLAHLASGEAGRAVAALDAAVVAGADDPATRLNLALALAADGQPDPARRALGALAEACPGWEEPWIRLAEILRERDPEGALAAYAHAHELAPRRSEPLRSMAVLRLRRGEPEAAQLLLLQLCGRADASAEDWEALGLALGATGDHEAAESAFAEACARDPGRLALAHRRLMAAMAAGSAPVELARLELLGRTHPLDAVAQAARGLLLGRMGQPDAAIDALEAAAALAPDHVEIARALAGALTETTRTAEAEAATRRARVLDPDDPVLAGNHAAHLTRLMRFTEAAIILEPLAAKPDAPVDVLCNLANAQLSVGDHTAALATARRELRTEPDNFLARRSYAHTLVYCDDVPGGDVTAAWTAASAVAPRTPPPTFARDRDPDRRLRVGLLSGNLRTHPVGWFTIAGFEQLPPDRFDLVAIGTRDRADAMARRFGALVSDWHEERAAGYPAMAERVRALDLDILIDLGGYGDAGMMPLCAHRVAPVQIKWVGAQNHTTGLAEMDWFITDRWETPPRLAPLFTERLLILPDGYVCYSPPAYAPAVAPLPALAAGCVTFGCFNNPAKMTARTLALWSRVLAAVPKSRLVLLAFAFADPGVRTRLHAGFAAHGIAAERVLLRPGVSHPSLLAAYGGIDIVLDPTPYAGGLTTCEALWMGVPTVTLMGETFASRHAASHLSNAGLTGWVATDADDYVRIATSWAGDPVALSTLRSGLRARLAASPLCDAPRFGRHLAAALRTTWRAWASGADTVTPPSA